MRRAEKARLEAVGGASVCPLQGSDRIRQVSPSFPDPGPVAPQAAVQEATVLSVGDMLGRVRQAVLWNTGHAASRHQARVSAQQRGNQGTGSV